VDTRLLNTQLLSRRDIQVWFWDGEKEFQGDCVALGDNGIWMEVKVRVPADGTLPNVALHLQSLRKKLKDKVVVVELTSPKVRAEMRLKLVTIDVLSQKKEMLSVVATYTSPPDPNTIRLLKEPMVTRIEKPRVNRPPSRPSEA